MEKALIVCPTKRMVTCLGRTVLEIRQQQERFIKEYLFSLALGNPVLIRAFSAVAFIPLKPLNLRQVEHGSCI